MMKYETAIKNAKKVADRIRRSNGLIGTPDCQYSVFKIKRAWLFGSTAKGKPLPNDVDILIEGFGVGRRQHVNQIPSIPWSNAAVDKEYKRWYRISLPKSSESEAIKFLTKNVNYPTINGEACKGGSLSRSG